MTTKQQVIKMIEQGHLNDAVKIIRREGEILRRNDWQETKGDYKGFNSAFTMTWQETVFDFVMIDGVVVELSYRPIRKSK